MLFRPCGSCARHVRDDERVCPFCGDELPAPPPPPRLAPGRFTRAAVFAGATILGTATAACGGAEPKPEGLAMEREATPPPPPVTHRPPDAGPRIVQEEDIELDWRRRRHRNDNNHEPMPYGAPPARDRRA